MITAVGYGERYHSHIKWGEAKVLPELRSSAILFPLQRLLKIL